MAKSVHPPAPSLTGVNVPLFWPMLAAAQMAEEGAELYARSLKFLNEEIKISHEQRLQSATANHVMLDLRTMIFRDYSSPDAKGVSTIVDAPYAGHSAMIADYQKGQSLIETLLANGVDRVFLTDWKSATEDMKDLEIDQYLAEINACVDDLGGHVNLIGLCQGGWMSAMYAARFPQQVTSLVLAGSPIDTDAVEGPVKRMAHEYPVSFYEELVALGGGLMLRGWKNMHPEEHYIKRHIDLYEHIDDPAYLSKEETFERWYENPIDLPGRWYLHRSFSSSRRTAWPKGALSVWGAGWTSRTLLARFTCWPGSGRYRDVRTGIRRREVSRHTEG
jgi:poly(3-hydroxybutyrate) depolymerase